MKLLARLNKEFLNVKDSSSTSLFPILTSPIEQKQLLFFSNAFTLFEGVISKKKVFVIELSYLTETTLNQQANVTQFQDNLAHYIPMEGNLKRVGFFYNKEENLFTIIYEKGTKTPFTIPKDATRLQKYQFIYHLITIMESFHNSGYSMSLIHPGLIFADENMKLNTIDNVFHCILPLINRQENIQLMNYFGLFKPDLYDQIIASYTEKNTPKRLIYKTDIIMLCVMVKYLFSNRNYDTILCECEAFMNNHDNAFDINDEPSLSNFVTNMISQDYSRVQTIQDFKHGFSYILNTEVKKSNTNLTAFACIKCGAKLSSFSTFHKCEEKKENKKRKDIKFKEQIDQLSLQIDNLPHLKEISLYKQYEEKEIEIGKEITQIHDDITQLIKQEEKKYNMIMDYAQNLFYSTETEKSRNLNEQIKKVEEVIKQSTEEFVCKMKEIKNSSLIAIKSGKKVDSLIHSEASVDNLDIFTTGFTEQMEQLKENEKDYEEFVKNSQRILGHANYEAKLQDLMMKIKEEYIKFLTNTNEYLVSFNEKIEEHSKLLESVISSHDKMTIKKEKQKMSTKTIPFKEVDDETPVAGIHHKILSMDNQK